MRCEEQTEPMVHSTKPIKEPSGELVELDFYFSQRSSADAIRDVTKHCLENGGECGASIYVSQFPDARETSFQGSYSHDLIQLDGTADELLKHFDDENKRVMRIPIRYALDISKDSLDIVTFSGVSQLASKMDSHPVALLAEGWVFSTPGYSRQAEKAGKQCYRKFVAYCEALRPDYAAILNENSLPCRVDLKQGVGKECFYDFFISFEAYGDRLISDIENMYRDSYVERSSEGIFVSTNPWYNPRKKGIDRTLARQRSTSVAGMLAK